MMTASSVKGGRERPGDSHQQQTDRASYPWSSWRGLFRAPDDGQSRHALIDPPIRAAVIKQFPTMVEFAVFTASFAAQHAAIEGDPQISDAYRAAFRRHMENCADVSNLSDHADQFCHAHQLLGAVVVLLAGERVGRAHRRIDFISLIATSLGLSTNDVEDLLQDWLTLGVAEQVDEINARIGNLPMSRYIIWAFRNNRSLLEPLEGLEIADLPCLLGLQYVSGTEFLFWG